MPVIITAHLVGGSTLSMGIHGPGVGIGASTFREDASDQEHQ